MLSLQANTPQRFCDNAAFHPVVARAKPPCRLMVVDDDDWMRIYLASVLRSASYEVDVVDSGKEALRRMRAESYDILLTDCLMPGMNGFDLCERVRGEFPDDSPYIVMFTVKDSREDRDAGLKSGADEYIVKGTPTRELLAKLNLGRPPLQRSSTPVTLLFHRPLCAGDAERSRANIALWNSYLMAGCVRRMVQMGWDFTT